MALSEKDKIERLTQFIKNNPGQSQESLTSQLIRLHFVANTLGLYDAADFLKRTMEKR